MKYLLNDMKFNFKSKFYISAIMIALGAIIISLYANWKQISGMKGLTFFFLGFGYGSFPLFTMLAPVICSLAAANTYVGDIKNNMLSQILLRSGRRKYILFKIITTGVLGASVMFLSTLLLLFVNFLFFPDLNPTYLGVISGPFSSVYEQNQLIYIIVLIINSTIFGFIYSNIGLATVIFFKKQYFAVVGPVIVYLFPTFIFPLIGLYSYLPSNTFSLYLSTNGTVFSQAMQFVVLSFLAMSFSYFSITRRKDMLN